MSSFSRFLFLVFLAVSCVKSKEVVEKPLHEVAVNPTSFSVLELGASQLDISIRMRALAELIRLSPDPAGGIWADRALVDPSPYVQKSGVDAVANRLPEPRAFELLRACVSRDEISPYIRGRAGFYLAKAGDTSTGPVLAQAWRNTPNAWDAAPLALAAGMMGDLEAVTPIIQALSEGAIPLEVDFIMGLGDSGLDLVSEMIDSKDLLEESLQIPLGLALIKKGKAIGETIVREFLTGEDEQLALEVLDYLSDYDIPETKTLLQKAESSPFLSVKRYARLIQVSRGEAPIDEAFELFEQENRELRAEVIFSLAEAVRSGVSKGDERKARELIRSSLEEDELFVNQAAAKALGIIGGETELLESLINIEELDLFQIELAVAIASKQ